MDKPTKKPKTRRTSPHVDDVVLVSTEHVDSMVRPAGGEDKTTSTRAGEVGGTHEDLSRRSLEAFAPESTTSTSGSGDATSDLAQGRERDQEELVLGERRGYLGSSNEANKVRREDMEDMDERELNVHHAQSTYLLRLEDSILNAEFSEFLFNSLGDEQVHKQEARGYSTQF